MARTNTRKPVAKKPDTHKRTLPAALVKTSKAAHAARLARLAAQGRDALARIKERKADIASNMFDIGVALTELKEDGVAAALGRTGFVELVALDVGMPLTTATALMALVKRVPRELAEKIGHGRAIVLLELSDAMPARTAPEDLFNAKVNLPSGSILDVPNSTDRELRDGAKEFRDARPSATRHRRGFTTSPEEKAAYADFDKGFRAHAAELNARTKLIATRDGRGPKLRIELRFSELRALITALRKSL